jgi:hypothetical protein
VLVAICGTAAAAPISVNELPSTQGPVVKTTKLPAGVSIEEADNNMLEVKGACAVQDVPDDWIDGVPLKQHGFRTTQMWHAQQSLAIGLERIVDDKLERYAVTLFHGGGHEVFAKTVVPLRVVAEIRSVKIYAYRRGDYIVLLAPTKQGAGVRFQADDNDGRRRFEFDQCSLALTQMHFKNGGSQPVEISGTAPDGSGFRMRASAVKTARDPAPVLSVALLR